MKRIILIFFYLALTTQIFGQNEFAQIGTIWKYSGTAFVGTFVQQGESVKDTIIQNLTFKKITCIEQFKGYCSPPDCRIDIYNSIKYFRQSNDSLFEYNVDKNKIILFFHYKLQKGDRIVTNLNLQQGLDSLLSYKVKWVSDTLFNGKRVKKWEIIPELQRDYYIYHTYVFLENIGFINSFIGIDYNPCFGFDCSGTNICGFENTTTKYSLGCNLVNAAKDISENINIKLSPNPSQNYIRIHAPNLNIVNVKIYDISGRTLINKPYTEGYEIDISGLFRGIYFVQLIDYQFNSVVKKFIKD